MLSARAASMCDLFVLPAASFKSILEEFPDVKVLVEHIAIHRLLELRKQLSDQTGSQEVVDKALFGSSSSSNDNLLSSEYNVFARRASVRDFMTLKKQSTSIDGSTLEHLVDSHSKSSDKCKLCQEDEDTLPLIPADGRSIKEIRKRIGIAKGNFQKTKSFFEIINLSMQLKIRLLKCYIWSILTHGCETADLAGNIDTAEMLFLRNSNLADLFRWAPDRELWNSVTAQACIRHGIDK
eukprot:gene10246-11299_t